MKSWISSIFPSFLEKSAQKSRIYWNTEEIISDWSWIILKNIACRNFWYLNSYILRSFLWILQINFWMLLGYSWINYSCNNFWQNSREMPRWILAEIVVKYFNVIPSVISRIIQAGLLGKFQTIFNFQKKYFKLRRRCPISIPVKSARIIKLLKANLTGKIFGVFGG